jgi:hypothetical protein
VVDCPDLVTDDFFPIYLSFHLMFCSVSQEDLHNIDEN